MSSRSTAALARASSGSRARPPMHARPRDQAARFLRSPGSCVYGRQHACFLRRVPRWLSAGRQSWCKRRSSSALLWTSGSGALVWDSTACVVLRPAGAGGARLGWMVSASSVRRGAHLGSAGLLVRDGDPGLGVQQALVGYAGLSVRARASGPSLAGHSLGGLAGCSTAARLSVVWFLGPVVWVSGALV